MSESGGGAAAHTVGKWLLAALVFYIAFRACSPVDGMSDAAYADIARQEREAAERQRMQAMTPAELIEILKPKLLAACQQAHPRFNYIEVRKVGAGLYCSHSMYSRYSLDIGPLAGNIQRFIANNQQELTRSKITRVGVQEKGQPPGVWFDLN